MVSSSARWYDPGTGQFLTTDFGGFIDGANLYWYAKNNPILYVDPTGFSAQGHPLSNLYNSFDVSYGGYSGGRVSAAPPPVYVSPTIQQLTNFGPVAQTFNPLGTSSSTFRPSAVNVHDLLPTGPTLLDQVSSVVYAGLGGLKTSGKAFVNAGASTAVSFGTLGFKQYDGPFSVTPQDIGYTGANIGFHTALEIGSGLLTGGLSQLSRAGSAARVAANSALAYDVAGNALSAGRGALDAYNYGPTLGNTVQIVGGGLGLGSNVAAGGQALREIASDVSRLRVEPAGLYGGVPVPKVRVQEHHLMTNKNSISTAAGGPFTPKFEELAAQRGITLNQAINKIMLPAHKGPHPAYNAEVYRILDGATQGLEGAKFNRAFDKTLEQVRTQTLKPGTTLNNLSTGQGGK